MLGSVAARSLGPAAAEQMNLRALAAGRAEYRAITAQQLKGGRASDSIQLRDAAG